MRQPEGFVVHGNENKVCRLQKSIYGLKQAARSWNETFNSVLLQESFKRSEADPCLYIKENDSSIPAFIVVHVDDILCVGTELAVREIFDTLSKYFTLTDLGNVSH